MKSKTTAYILWFFGYFGVFGFHQFYLGKYGRGIIYLFTGGLLCLGAFWDFFTLGAQVDKYNDQHYRRNKRTFIVREL